MIDAMALADGVRGLRMADSVSLERLRELLTYDAETGLFYWLNTTRRGGAVAGFNSHGYVRISIDGRGVRAHRLAWLWVHGKYPPAQIDHINGIRNDNRIVNLREATNSQNNANQSTQSKNSLGIKGVKRAWRSSTYVASIKVNGKYKHLGCFETAEAARQAYVAASKEAFGEFTRLT